QPIPMTASRPLANKRTKSMLGFTLIELMIALLLLGVLLGIGVPSMYTMVQDSQLSSQQRVLLGAINLARSEAVNRNQTVTLSHKSTTAGDWSQGLLMYADATAAGNTTYDAANDTLIKDIESFGEGGTINADDAGENFIRFRSNCMLEQGSNTCT